MRYLIVAAACVLCVAIAQENDVPIPCDNDESCSTFRGIAGTVTCKEGYCNCEDENGQSQKCSTANAGTGQQQDPKSAIGMLGRTCNNDKDCSFENSLCNTTRKQCLCKKDFVTATDNMRCLKVAETLGSGCEEDKQCTTKLNNTNCVNKECKCAENFHFTNNACWRTIKLGETCTVNEECTQATSAECSTQKICACPNGTVTNVDGRRCLPVAAGHGSECLETIQCSEPFGKHSYCMNKKCDCHEHYHFNLTTKSCISNKALGEACNADNECYQEDMGNDTRAMHCYAGRCACSDGYDRMGDKCKSNGASMATISGAFIGSVLLSLLL